MTAFSQRDPRWAHERLGTSELTLGEAGCLLTSLASLLADWAPPGLALDPAALNAWLVESGGYVDGCRLVFGGVEPLGARLRAWVDYYSTPANLVRIGKSLADGWGALALVDARPGCHIQAHWVRLLAVQQADCLIMDPWREPGHEVSRLSERYGCPGWHGGRPIFVYVGYERVHSARAPAEGMPESRFRGLHRAAWGRARVQQALHCYERPDKLGVVDG